MSAVFDRLRRSKYGYVATGWTTFIDNLNRPENAEIAEMIKNDKDFFAHNETILAAKDIGKLRRAIKSAIGRAGAVAYMEKGRIERDGVAEVRWDWRDFTNRVIDAGLAMPKEERRMWILNCNSLKKGEKIKLPGTREEYEVLDVNQAGEAKITGPLGRISAKAEVLVWRPGSQFAEKVSEKVSATDSATLKTDSKKADSQTEARTGTRTTSTETRKGEQDMASGKTKSGSAWQQNDGETAFGFGMLVRRGKLTGKVIRAHGSKLRVRLDDEGGTVEWNADDESIYWKSLPNSDDEGEGQKTGGKTGGKTSGKSTTQAPARKGRTVEEPEEEEEEEEELVEEEEVEDEEEEEEEEEEIDPADLPDDDDDLLEVEEDDEDEIDPEEETEEEEEEEESEEEEPAEGEQEFDYSYSGNDIADLAGTDYQRVNKLKAQGVLDGTFIQAANGRIRYSIAAVKLVKNAPKKKPGRPPGGGKKTASASVQSPTPVAARPVDKAPQKQQPAALQPQQPRQEVLNIPAQAPAQATASTSVHSPKTGGGGSLARSLNLTQPDIFADTVLKLEAEIERRENELDRLKEALEVVRSL